MPAIYRVSDATIHLISDAEWTSLLAHATKAANHRLYVIDAQPVPNAGEKVVDAGVVVGPVEARRTWALAPKTADELEADAQVSDLNSLKAALTAITAEIAAGITQAPTTAAQAFVEIQDLKRRALRTDRAIRWLIKQQG
jgi:hypothetical protein